METDIPSNTNGERPVSPVSLFREGHFPVQIRPRTVEDVMRVTMASKRIIVVVTDAVVVTVGVRHSCTCKLVKWEKDEELNLLSGVIDLAEAGIKMAECGELQSKRSI